MKALKGLFVYIGIVIGILAVVAVFMFSLSYFVPDLRVMGVGVVHFDEQFAVEKINPNDYADFSAVEIRCTSKNVDIVVAPHIDSTDIKYDLALNVFGIAFDITQFQIVKQIEVEDGRLKINLSVTEPNGTFFLNRSRMLVSVPSTMLIDVIVNTNKGDIELGGSKAQLQMHNLTINADKGKVNFVNLGTGDTVKTLTLNSLNLTTNSGKFDFTTIENLLVNNKIMLSANNGSFVFQNLFGSVDVKGTGISITAKNITSGGYGFSFISEKGNLNITKLSTPVGAENTIISEYCNIAIDEIVGKTGIVSTFGNIGINKLHSNTIIQNTHGNVYIKTALQNINVVTEFGDITIDDYKKNAKFVSSKGNITVVGTGDYVDRVYTEIRNKDGNVSVQNKVNRLLVETTGKSTVTVVFDQIKGGLDVDKTFQHIIKVNPSLGKCVAYLPANITEPFKFMAKGIISGEISGLVNEYEGYNVMASDEYQYYPNVESQDLTVNSCYFLFDGKIHFVGYQ